MEAAGRSAINVIMAKDEIPLAARCDRVSAETKRPTESEKKSAFNKLTGTRSISLEVTPPIMTGKLSTGMVASRT
jgi:hypothetical protein